MKKFTYHIGKIIPINISNIDTDIIIPKQFLQRMEKTGFGKNLFHDWRYLDPDGKKINPEFILNHSKFKNSSILLTGENFGCGSSREHAVWALIDYGIKIIIAPSFSDIFYNNAFNNNLLLITLNFFEIDDIYKIIVQKPGLYIHVNLIDQSILIENKKYYFKINKFLLHRIINKLDDISLTLKNFEKIKKWERDNLPFYVKKL